MPDHRLDDLIADLTDFVFSEPGETRSLLPDPDRRTRVEPARIAGREVPKFINEFWTARQRQAASLHEISYRACFKPQLPRFFIERMTQSGDTVYDPFGGRGTTALEAGLLGRRPISNDVNPLSQMLTRPRFFLLRPGELETRLAAVPVDDSARADRDLSMFFHARTEAELVSLKNYLAQRRAEGLEDDADRWIRMVATNRLTGHSAGFFSVYTLPPNQAVSPERQILINERRNQKPEYRDTKALILKKTRSLARNLTSEQQRNLARVGREAVFLTGDARHTSDIPSNSVQLTVTSPPFLKVVQYDLDNWLRCWFNGLDSEAIGWEITMPRKLTAWSAIMGEVFMELHRVTRPDGWVAFEVGEVLKGKIRLEDEVVPLGLAAGFECPGVLLNVQQFTKTSNIWGVDNNRSGTNTNRIALFHKP
ncbi:MAG: site-specific DNA-methyltransferase [Proteobacteria bacterium]|nr:site-specific DNA-methyltransferase [Pseudomonadota bacterium]